MVRLFTPALLALGTLTAPSVASAEELLLTPQQQLDQIRSWEGRWRVAEADALQIVFEATARGTVMVERWEVSGGLHSMTVYHLDGEYLVATHYCPQGNQPRLESKGSANGDIRFTFRDVTDLDPGESHTHDLWFSNPGDGTILRSEVYRGSEGLQKPGRYTLSRIDEGS